jgi:ABC-type multidrug transport system fused ATPase/permease subunit
VPNWCVLRTLSRNDFVLMQNTLDLHGVKRILSILNKRDFAKLVMLTMAQIINSFLDLLAILLIGVVTATTFLSAQGKSPSFPSIVENLFRITGLSESGFNKQIGMIAAIAGLLLVAKSILSALITKRQFLFLGLRSAQFGVNLYRKILSQDYNKLSQITPSDVQFSVMRGTNSLFMGVIGSLSVIVNEIVFLLVMFSGLATVDLSLTIIALLYFSVLAFLLSKKFGVQIQSKSKRASKQNVGSESKVSEVISLIREVKLRGTTSKFVKDFEVSRMDNARISASIQFIPIVIKYWMEIALVLGALLLAGYQFVLFTAEEVVPTLVVFLTAATRVTPSILRIQNAYLTTRSSLGTGSIALDFINRFDSKDEKLGFLGNVVSINQEEDTFIVVKNIEFSYENRAVIEDFSLSINKGDFVAIVGPTGSGKSTILNLIMGQLIPSAGTVRIEGMQAAEYASKFSGDIGFVSQEPVFFDTSIRENLLLGLKKENVNEDDLWRALEIAQVSQFVSELPDKLLTDVGSRGSKLSMGQRQRLSIARALLTRPKILLLDEATSALDAVTEHAISQALSRVKSDTTIIVVAHRLSTIRQAKTVAYLAEGRLICKGSFEEVRKRVADFDRAAEISGL